MGYMGYHRRPAGTRQGRLDRTARIVTEVCADAGTTAELIDGLREPVHSALDSVGTLLSATDPVTTALGTATVVDGLPDSMATPWMRNEYLEDDFNKFRSLHRAAAPVTTLHRATQGRPRLSPRHRRLNLAHGLGPELRATFSVGDRCWGVATALRAAGDDDFDDTALAWLDTIRPIVAEGIRRTTVAVAAAPADDAFPGVVTLGPGGDVVSMTDHARRMLAGLWLCPFTGEGKYQLPGEAYMIATLALARNNGCRQAPPPVTRLRDRSGRWLTMRGDCVLTPDGRLEGIVLVIEASRSAELLPVAVAAAGLTERERHVLSEVLAGRGTGEIAARLFISPHTVRDHIKAIFTKTGTASRGELMSLLFGAQRAGNGPARPGSPGTGFAGTPPSQSAASMSDRRSAPG